MKELKIEVPEGHCIDRENSTFELVRFKKIEKKFPSSWEDMDGVQGYYCNINSGIHKTDPNLSYTFEGNHNIFTTEEQAKASLALAQLSQLKKVYREIEGGQLDWTDAQVAKYCIKFYGGSLAKQTVQRYSEFLTFTKEATRDLFFKNFKELIKQAKPLMMGE
jgi:hypothetical protein